MNRKLTCMLLVLVLVLCAVPMALATEAETPATEPPAHTHCECGGTLTDAGKVGHTCGEAITYEPLTADAFVSYTQQYYSDTSTKTVGNRTLKVLASGNYYLEDDFELTSSMGNAGVIVVKPGDTVKLCLNGKKLTTAGRSFQPNGNLAICDCAGGGQVYSKTKGSSPVMYSYSGSVVDIYGGSFSSVESNLREYAGCMVVAKDLYAQDICLEDDAVVDNDTQINSVANIYGGTFYGSDLNTTDANPAASGRGGCFVVMHSGVTLNVYDCHMIGAKTVDRSLLGLSGGGVIASSGNCNIYGGKFTDSKDPLGAVFTSTSNLTISGNPVFENNLTADVYAAKGVSVNVGSLNTSVKVYASKLALTDAAQLDKIIPADYITYTLDGTIATASITGTRTGCICGGNLSATALATGSHECADVTWQPLNMANVEEYFSNSSNRYYLRTNSAYLYLTEDVDLLYGINLNKQANELHIDLNGYTLSHNAGRNQLFGVSGTLTVCDSSEAQTGRMEGTRVNSTTEAPCVYLVNKSGSTYFKPVFTLYGGTLTGRNITSRLDHTLMLIAKAGVIQVSNNDSTTNYGTFNMYGGALVPQNTCQYGGTLYIYSGIINMYDGTISGGNVVKNASGGNGHGGNIAIGNNCTVNLYGGTISGGKALENCGGNLYVSGSKSKLNLLGTRIEGGESVNGGNIYCTDGTVTLNGSVITGGEATNNGGNIYSKATFTMESGTITLGECGNEGGNVWTSTKTFTMNKGTISNGTAVNGAGNMMIFGKVLLNSGTIIEGTSQKSSGGNIRLFNGGDLTIAEGFTISNGYAGANAGNISAAGTSVTTVCGTVTGGEAIKNGGNIVVDSTASVTINGATVNAGTAAGLGDNIYAAGTVNLLGASTLDSQESGLYIKGATVTVDDTFTTETPVVVVASAGKLAAANTDKSALFLCPTSSVSWNAEEKALYLNGLIETQTGETFATFAEAMATGDHTIFTLLDNHTGNAEISGKVWINLNGKKLTGNVTGTGTLYGYDTSSDDYKGADGRITGTVSCNVAPHFQGSNADICTANRYMAIADETGYTFHRFYLGVTHATIRPDSNGMGYKAMFCGDDAVKAQLAETDAFGYTLQLGQFLPWSVSKAQADFVSGKSLTLRIDGFDIAKYGATDLTACVFVKLADGTVIESATVTRSMKQVMEAINGMVDSLSVAQMSAVQTMVKENEEAMAGWNIDAIRNWKAPVTPEPSEPEKDVTE